MCRDGDLKHSRRRGREFDHPSKDEVNSISMDEDIIDL